MKTIFPTLLAGALALALAGAAGADEFITSRGARSLPPVQTLKGEPRLRQVERDSEELVFQLLQDIKTIEASRSSVSDDAASLKEKIRKSAAELQRAKADFEQLDQKYRTDLAAFQQSQVALEGEVQRQRADAAALEALPSAQRDYAQVTRINNWAQEIGRKRQELETTQSRLLADHDRVEAERARVAKLYADSEQKLQGQRAGTVGQFQAAEQKRIAAHQQLRKATLYWQQVRDLLNAATAPRTVPPSPTLSEAKAALAAFDTRAR
jgi:chromosome segregation ATPase